MNMFAINYSVRGSSRRSEEERAVGYWRDWLIDVEGGDAVLVVEDTENRVTLNQLLMFVTGADRGPPLGFPGEPTINFLHTVTIAHRSRGSAPRPAHSLRDTRPELLHVKELSAAPINDFGPQRPPECSEQHGYNAKFQQFPDI
ncbi:unnamed protein product [Pleuronectes platessa]|uniref:Uncharacterized protein n=1 Tax=Pleuronectes platessa TaxID=8262 RepID=A0A9N7U6D1_PLEPL|nr:unnamed protein product [Pleuronectes platessa]